MASKDTTNAQIGNTSGVLCDAGDDSRHEDSHPNVILAEQASSDGVPSGAGDDPELILDVHYFIPTEQAFLPKKIGDKLVMRQIYNNKFEATNEFLNSDDKGLYYKRSPSLNRPIPTREDGVAAFLPWGQSTYGVEEKDHIAIFALQQQSAPLSGQPLPLQDLP